MRTLTPRKGLAALAIAVAVAAACGTLDTQDSVHDLRILAIRADPPEQLYGVPTVHHRDGGMGLTDGGPNDGGGMHGFSFDGGLAGLLDAGLDLCELLADVDAGGLLPPGFDAGCGSTHSLSPYTLTALIADPNGHGRTLHYAWATCLAVDTAGRCESGEPGYQALTQGDVTPTGISDEISTTYLPSPELLLLAKGTGLASFDLPVQITVSAAASSDAGADTEIGVKLVVVTPYLPYEPQVPNSNPVFSGLRAGGIEWSPANPPIFTSVEAGGSTSGGSGALGGGPAGGVPVVTELDAGAELYVRYATDGTPTHVEERLQFDFYTTMGDFSPATAGRGGNAVFVDAGPELFCLPDPETGACSLFAFPDGGYQSADAGTVDGGPDAGPLNQSYWTSATNQATQTVTFWVVARDQRGGENWIERTAEYSP